MTDTPTRPAPHDPRPRATYRLQFHKDFPFAAARELGPYLAELGISHVYSSPVLTARAGSVHGYDVVDYDRINPELGGEDGFRELASALRQHGIGIVLDIVPNHMAVGGADNRLWLDLLKHGRASDYAAWFDVDFDCPDPDLHGKVHAPFLGRPLAEELAAGALSLVAHGDGYAVSYGEHLFPIRPQDEGEIAAAGIAAFAEPDRLEHLLARQNFLLDWWRNAGDRINWRRFFDITQLAAVRMEEPAAFRAKHAVAFRLYREGLIDGLRIDHVDGLSDPAGYCGDLRAALDALQAHRPEGLREVRAWLVVEKILAHGERLPEDWQVDGTTGYDFMDEISALQHDPSSAIALSAHWAALSGRPRDFQGEEEIARREVLAFSFDGQRERLVDALEEAGARHRDGEGLTRAALRRAVSSLIAQMRAYRSYATGRGDGVGAGPFFEAALARALAAASSDPPALRFIASVIAGEGEERAVRRFNQLSAPLAAKAVEDTAFYRHGRLVSRNDVGFDAGLPGLETEGFHALMQARAALLPASMLTTATHDHKRGEDLRARLAVLSEIPQDWIAATEDWRELNAAIRPEGLDAGEEYVFYQMLVGAWPTDLDPEDAGGLSALSERLAAWTVKALREAKLRSGWASPDEAYEDKARRFVTRALTPMRERPFLRSVARFVDRIMRPGAVNGLVQAALRCTVPGVPDCYQGTEFWDFSLVDPDNRRPVDFASRRIALAQDLPLDRLARSWRDGRVKQALLRRLLALRRAEPELFASGGYEPLAIEGQRAGNVLAFLRRAGGSGLLVVAARCCFEGIEDGEGLVPPAEWWGDTPLFPPAEVAEAHPVIGPAPTLEGAVPVADLLPLLPVGVWRLRFG